MKINEDYIISDLADSKVAVKNDSGDTPQMVSLNSTAGEILDLVSKGLSEDEICLNFVSTYSISEEQAKKDIGNTLKKLLELGIICE